MSSGIKRSNNRPKLAKHLRTSTKKRFRNESAESLAKYREKITKRASRKLKKKRK